MKSVFILTDFLNIYLVIKKQSAYTYRKIFEAAIIYIVTILAINY